MGTHGVLCWLMVVHGAHDGSQWLMVSHWADGADVGSWAHGHYWWLMELTEAHGGLWDL